MSGVEQLADKAQNLIDFENASNPRIKKMLSIVKKFLEDERVLCYGGTAINNILSEENRFYDPNYDVPDYDFYSEIPQIHAMKLADIFYSKGYTNIEVKPGAHLMTFKVFVEYIGVADITYLELPIFKVLWDEDNTKNKIHYVSPNFLRMSMYLELSRPRGDVSRWSKVYHRLSLLNKEYPIGCSKTLDDDRHSLTDESRKKIEKVLEEKDIILMGLRATDFHSVKPSNIWKLPIDVLVDTSKYDKIVDEFSKIFGNKNVRLLEHPEYAELLPKHMDIIDKETGYLLVRVFETLACHSYHKLYNGIKIASIPTLLQFFFAFVYADAHYLEGYDQNRIICIAQRLIDMANSQSSRRFKILTPIDCVGHQHTLVEMKQDVTSLKEGLKPKSDDFLKFFFKYNPEKLTKTQKSSLRKRLTKTVKSLPSVQHEIAIDTE